MVQTQGNRGQAGEERAEAGTVIGWEVGEIWMK